MKLELSHDALAKSIFEKFSAEDKMRVQIRKLLTDRLVYYKTRQTLLSKDDLNYIDPYIDTIELERDQLELVRESKKYLKRKKKQLTFIVTGAIVLLLVFNLITFFLNRTNTVLLQEEEERVRALAKEDSLKQLAERHADTLYQQLLATNPEFTQQLIASFDTLKMTNKMVEKERNIAQSATLSNLGEEALEQNDKNYAFKLAAKAWELNHDNKLACELLYKISDSDYNEHGDSMNINTLNGSEKESYMRNLIAKERNEKGRGELKDKEVELIFNRNNSIVKDKGKGVRDKIKKYYNKMEEEANVLEEKIKDLK